MSTILCRQPSMDSSYVLEATSMRLKLVSPKSHNQTSCFTSWNLPQSPSHKSVEDYFNTEINTNLYNPKSLKLSAKSLELCTESLGSETGSDISDNDAINCLPTSKISVTKIRRDPMESKKVLPRSLPPPLITLSGSKLFHVRPHREGDRLVIEAIETSLENTCLHVERSNGRLRLTCWKNEKGDLDLGGHENDMESKKSEEEGEINVVIEKLKRLRRCNEDDIGEKGICCNWEPCCWVATS